MKFNMRWEENDSLPLAKRSTDTQESCAYRNLIVWREKRDF